jgi:hypothetical protein
MEYTKNDIGYNLKLFDVEGVFFAHLFVSDLNTQMNHKDYYSVINKVGMLKLILVSMIMLMKIIKNFNRMNVFVFD